MHHTYQENVVDSVYVKFMICTFPVEFKPKHLRLLSESDPSGNELDDDNATNRDGSITNTYDSDNNCFAEEFVNVYLTTAASETHDVTLPDHIVSKIIAIYLDS